MQNLVGANLGKYRLVSPLGRGGMAEVYKAYQPSLDRFVAVKVLPSDFAKDQDFIQRFEREAALVARLRHPNIVQVYDFDVIDDLYYMVMELIEGPTLTSELAERLRFAPSQYTAAFNPEEITHLFTDLASAVDYAHLRGMIHGDLKPSNIMFTADGQVVLTDFGIAHLLSESNFTPAQGRAGGTPAYMAPELEHQRGDRHSDVYALGVILFELCTGRVPFIDDTPELIMWRHAKSRPPPPTVFNPTLPSAVDDVVLRALNKAPAERYASAGALAQGLREAYGLTLEQVLAAPPIRTLVSLKRDDARAPTDPIITPIVEATLRPPTPPCPYRGLFAFREQDAPFFFGREDFTDRLTEMVEVQPLVALIGPSGSGKSSVVFAGLLPSLRQGSALRQARGQAWVITDLRPGPNPFESLAAVLSPDLTPSPAPTAPARGKGGEVRTLAESLQRRATSLGLEVQRILSQHPDAHRVLLVVDQFEELYTLCVEPETRRAFIETLLDGARRNPSLRLVCTVRADFLGQALSFRPFADALQDASLILGPMTQAELTRAIREPARKQATTFQSGLVERILDDVGDEPGNLPLLEFALTALWAQQSAGQLTHAAYDDIERVDGALARYAEETYAQLEPEEKDRARRVFVQMVLPGEATEDTRRQATRAELEANWPVVQKLADARLLVTNRDPSGQDTAEIVHEALIRGWGRLREWMRANRNFRAWQERTRVTLRQWEASGRDEGALLRGALLVGAEGWLAEREAEIGQAERHFIRASIALRERETAEREAQRQRELETAQKLAEAERQRAEEQARAARQLRQRSILPAITLGIAVTATIIALTLTTQANQEIREAQSREFAALAQAQMIRDPQLGLLLALHAMDQTATPEALNALLQAMQAVDPQASLPDTRDPNALLSQARARLRRGWTPEECQVYLRRATCPAMP